MKLYKVLTTRYDDYYVEARDFNEARDKVIGHVRASEVLTKRGDLNTLIINEDSISEIRLLTDELIK